MRAFLFPLAVSALCVAAPAVQAEAPPDTEKTLQQLILQLKEGDPLARQDAADELGKLGPKAVEAVPVLCAALQEKSLRGPAAAALARIGRPAVPALIEVLKRDDFRIQDSAADALAKVGRDAVPALVEVLRDQASKPVHWKALMILGNIGPAADDAIPALLEKLHGKQLTFDPYLADSKQRVPILRVRDEAYLTRFPASFALRRIGPKALPVLVEASKDNGRIRWSALLSLFHYCLHEFPVDLLAVSRKEDMPLAFAQLLLDFPRLIDAVKDHDTITRGLAVSALGDMKGQRMAVRALTEALRDRAPRVRIEAAKALGRMGPEGKTAIPALLEALKDEGYATEDELTSSEVRESFFWQPNAVREAAAWALVDLGPEGEDRLVHDGLPALIAGLKSPDFGVREASAQALAALGPKAAKAVPELVQAVEVNENQPQWAAVTALQLIGPDAVPGLVRLLGHPNPKVRSHAVTCLAQMSPRSKALLEALGQALRDKDSTVREEAAEVLGQISPRTRNAIPAQRGALKDKDAKVALAAASALAKRGSDTAETKAALSALLKHEDIEIREEALKALLPLGAPTQETVPVLEEMAKDKRMHYCRWLAIRLLGHLSRERAEAAAVQLARILTEEGSPGSITGSFADLGPAGRLAIPILLEKLEKPPEPGEPQAREDVILALGELRAERAVLAMVQGLEDDRTFETTAEGLGRMGSAAKEAVLPLTVALRDVNQFNRAAAAAALGEIGPDAKRAVPRLKLVLGDSSGKVRAWAAYALIKITGDDASYTRILTELMRGKTDADGGILEAAQALDRLAPLGQSAIPALIQALEDPDPWTRHSAAIVLGKFGTAAEGAIPRLIARLRDERSARQLMLRLGEEETVPAAAARALGQIGPAAADAIPRLTELARSEDVDLAEAAEEALAKIRGTQQKP